jgi:hypothetical protein
VAESITLYRPVGLREWELILQSGRRAFPPRLPEQPIFYPVLNYDYAEQIARDWNTKSHDYLGIVTRFAVDAPYASRFERQTVGARMHEELWVPAEELDAFNEQIVGTIDGIVAFVGGNYSGPDPRTLEIREIREIRPATQ